MPLARSSYEARETLNENKNSIRDSLARLTAMGGVWAGLNTLMTTIKARDPFAARSSICSANCGATSTETSVAGLLCIYGSGGSVYLLPNLVLAAVVNRSVTCLSVLPIAARGVFVS